MLSRVVTAIVCLPALLTFVWFYEVLASCFASRKGRTSAVASPRTLFRRTTVLIRAHNKRAGILPTIQNVQAQLGPANLSVFPSRYPKIGLLSLDYKREGHICLDQNRSQANASARRVNGSYKG
jgi:hypothetical protein